MRISAALLDAIVEHARREAPNECCGIVEVANGEAIAVHPVTNAAASPFRFEMEGRELVRIVNELEDAGHDVGVVYHSHTRSAPYPSQTDITFAAHWPGWQWLIVGLDGAEPEVRLYAIADGVVEELLLS